jgi:exosome complex component RRP4
MNRLVVPGEVISDKPVKMPYTYTDGQKTYATVISLLNDSNRLIPLEGPYEPLENDIVIGYVKDARFNGYDVEINSANGAYLSTRNTRSEFKLGDIISTRISRVDEVNSIDLSDGRLLKDGYLKIISPVKVPRLIGKRNSMINMIVNATGTQVEIGRNGIVFVSNSANHVLASKAIDMIEELAHTSGLTDKVANYLTEHTGKTVRPPEVGSEPTREQGSTEYHRNSHHSNSGQRRRFPPRGGNDRRRR